MSAMRYTGTSEWCGLWDHATTRSMLEAGRMAGRGGEEDFLCVLNRVDQQDDSKAFECGAYEPI